MRHGQVAEGHTNRYHGHNDIGLCPPGEPAIRSDLAAQLAAMPLAGVYSSDLTRTIKTAPGSSAGAGAWPPRVIPEFREVNFGAWEGLTLRRS